MYYYILATNQDIVHRSHKYIERVKTSSGKWRYIYKKSPYSGKSKKGSLKSYLKSYSDYRKTVSNLKKAEENKKQVLKQNELNRKNRLNTTGLSDEAKVKQTEVDLYRLKYSEESVKKAEKEMYRAWNKLESTPLGKATKAFNIGIQVAKTLLPTVFNNVKVSMKEYQSSLEKINKELQRKKNTTTLPSNNISSIKITNFTRSLNSRNKKNKVYNSLRDRPRR